MRKWPCALYCFLSGVLTAMTYNVQELWFLCFFALMPFLAVMLWKKQTKKRSFFYTFSFFMGYYIALLTWFGELISVVAGSLSPLASVLVMVLAILAVALIESTAMSIAMLPFSRLHCGSFTDVLVFAALYALGEWGIAQMGSLAFPWARLANITAPAAWFVQGASLFGGLFVSMIVICVSGFAVYGLLHLRNRRTVLLAGACAVCVFAVNTVFGIVRMGIPNEPAQETEILLVQGNFSAQNKWSMATKSAFEAYIRLSKQNKMENTKIIVWPETAVTVELNRPEGKEYRAALSEFACANGITLITGSFFRSEEGKRYNSLYAFFPNGEMSEPYHKQLLVPMGEFIPLRGLMRALLPELINSSIFKETLTPGTETMVFTTPDVAFGGVICYESIDPSITRTAASNGAELLVMITNDSWFGSSAALRQHLSHAVLRAVETHRSLVRSGNSGITASVDAYGRIMGETEINEQNTLLCSAAIYRDATLYSVVGDWPVAVSGFVLWIAAVIKAIFQRNSQQCKRKTEAAE